MSHALASDAAICERNRRALYQMQYFAIRDAACSYTFGHIKNQWTQLYDTPILSCDYERAAVCKMRAMSFVPRQMQRILGGVFW